MVGEAPLKVVAVEVKGEGILVQFSDGVVTVFPSLLLRACADLAEILNETAISSGEE